MNSLVKWATILLVMSSLPLFAADESPKLNVEPAKTVLSPALIKAPIVFTGFGYQPKETVIVDLIIPPGVTMKGLKEGEDRVGVAYGTADEKGNFRAPVGPTALLNWFFQVGWTPMLTPDFKEAKPLPPGTYEFEAAGMDSEKTSKTTLELLPPPPKK
jgi:hypothetical protein